MSIKSTTLLVRVRLCLYSKRDACKFVRCVCFTPRYPACVIIPSKVSWEDGHTFLPHKQAAFHPGAASEYRVRRREIDGGRENQTSAHYSNVKAFIESWHQRESNPSHDQALFTTHTLTETYSAIYLYTQIPITNSHVQITLMQVTTHTQFYTPN